MSPYLADQQRLADVIAAIQVMGTYKYYKLDFEGWSDRISGDSRQAKYWEKVFEQHPEFFRLDASRDKASLVWRRQHQNYSMLIEKIKSLESSFIKFQMTRKSVYLEPLSHRMVIPPKRDAGQKRNFLVI